MLLSSLESGGSNFNPPSLQSQNARPKVPKVLSRNPQYPKNRPDPPPLSANQIFYKVFTLKSILTRYLSQ